MERNPPDGGLLLRVPSGDSQTSRRLGRSDCLERLSPKTCPAASKPKIRDCGRHSDQKPFFSLGLRQRLG